VKRAVAELLAIPGDAGDVRAGALVQSDQLADERDLLLAALAEERTEATGQLGVGDRLGVVVEEREPLAEERAQQAVRHAGAGRLSTAVEELHGLRASLDPALELGH